MTRRRKLMPPTGERFNSIVAEYFPHDGHDDDEMRALKECLLALPQAERNILVAYAETQSLTELAVMLHVGRTTAAKEVRRIRALILDNMKTKGYDYNDTIHDARRSGDGVRR